MKARSTTTLPQVWASTAELENMGATSDRDYDHEHEDDDDDDDDEDDDKDKDKDNGHDYVDQDEGILLLLRAEALAARMAEEMRRFDTCGGAATSTDAAAKEFRLARHNTRAGESPLSYSSGNAPSTVPDLSPPSTPTLCLPRPLSVCAVPMRTMGGLDGGDGDGREMPLSLQRKEQQSSSSSSSSSASPPRAAVVHGGDDNDDWEESLRRRAVVAEENAKRMREALEALQRGEEGKDDIGGSSSGGCGMGGGTNDGTGDVNTGGLSKVGPVPTTTTTAAAAAMTHLVANGTVAAALATEANDADIAGVQKYTSASSSSYFVDNGTDYCGSPRLSHLRLRGETYSHKFGHNYGDGQIYGNGSGNGNGHRPSYGLVGAWGRDAAHFDDDNHNDNDDDDDDISNSNSNSNSTNNNGDDVNSINQRLDTFDPFCDVSSIGSRSAMSISTRGSMHERNARRNWNSTRFRGRTQTRTKKHSRWWWWQQQNSPSPSPTTSPMKMPLPRRVVVVAPTNSGRASATAAAAAVVEEEEAKVADETTNAGAKTGAALSKSSLSYTTVVVPRANTSLPLTLTPTPTPTLEKAMAIKLAIAPPPPPLHSIPPPTPPPLATTAIHFPDPAFAASTHPHLHPSLCAEDITSNVQPNMHDRKDNVAKDGKGELRQQEQEQEEEKEEEKYEWIREEEVKDPTIRNETLHSLSLSSLSLLLSSLETKRRRDEYDRVRAEAMRILASTLDGARGGRGGGGDDDDDDDDDGNGKDYDAVERLRRILLLEDGEGGCKDHMGKEAALGLPCLDRAVSSMRNGLFRSSEKEEEEDDDDDDNDDDNDDDDNEEEEKKKKKKKKLKQERRDWSDENTPTAKSISGIGLDAMGANNCKASNRSWEQGRRYVDGSDPSVPIYSYAEGQGSRLADYAAVAAAAAAATTTNNNNNTFSSFSLPPPMNGESDTIAAIERTRRLMEEARAAIEGGMTIDDDDVDDDGVIPGDRRVNVVDGHFDSCSIPIIPNASVSAEPSKTLGANPPFPLTPPLPKTTTTTTTTTAMGAAGGGRAVVPPLVPRGTRCVARVRDGRNAVATPASFVSPLAGFATIRGPAKRMTPATTTTTTTTSTALATTPAVLSAQGKAAAVAKASKAGGDGEDGEEDDLGVLVPVSDFTRPHRHRHRHRHRYFNRTRVGGSRCNSILRYREERMRKRVLAKKKRRRIAVSAVAFVVAILVVLLVIRLGRKGDGGGGSESSFANYVDVDDDGGGGGSGGEVRLAASVVREGASRDVEAEESEDGIDDDDDDGDDDDDDHDDDDGDDDDDDVGDLETVVVVGGEPDADISEGDYIGDMAASDDETNKEPNWTKGELSNLTSALTALPPLLVSNGDSNDLGTDNVATDVVPLPELGSSHDSSIESKAKQKLASPSEMYVPDSARSCDLMDTDGRGMADGSHAACLRHFSQDETTNGGEDARAANSDKPVCDFAKSPMPVPVDPDGEQNPFSRLKDEMLSLKKLSSNRHSVYDESLSLPVITKGENFIRGDDDTGSHSLENAYDKSKRRTCNGPFALLSGECRRRRREARGGGDGSIRKDHRHP